MNRKTAIIVLFLGLLLVAGLLYFGGQKTAREAENFRATMEIRQIQVILSLTPHG